MNQMNTINQGQLTAREVIICGKHDKVLWERMSSVRRPPIVSVRCVNDFGDTALFVLFDSGYKEN